MNDLIYYFKDFLWNFFLTIVMILSIIFVAMVFFFVQEGYDHYKNCKKND